MVIHTIIDEYDLLYADYDGKGREDTQNAKQDFFPLSSLSSAALSLENYYNFCKGENII